MICTMVEPQLTTDDVVLQPCSGFAAPFEYHYERCCHDDFSRCLFRDVRTPAGHQAGSFLAQVDGPSLAEVSATLRLILSRIGLRLRRESSSAQILTSSRSTT
ncbi:hypothetical protein SMAC4_13109 [Sordaria macrospora]|uniref:uncharacterized protein n=1 Tax=Sordaria macrospora TaxID=5147 RepID=UPI002B31ED06|nr:hypothetical protein SMAC4_13109 [Sordaria macrospora]